MAPKKWGDELNLKFIEAYKENECLWNQYDPLYKNKFARESALKNLADEMQLDGFGVVEVKAKIKSLRSTYNLELEKKRKSEKSGAVYVPTVKWFNIMKEVMTKGTLQRQTQSNLTLASQTANSIDSEPDDVGEPSGIIPQIICARSPHSDEDTPDSFRRNDDLQPQKKKFKLCSRIQQIASTARQLQQLSESINCSSSEAASAPRQDEWDIFGNLVAAHLKKLSPQRALQAEMKIYAVLHECRMQDLMAPNPLPS